MLGLYIHIPFCRKKCNYCDFVSAPGNGELITRYVEALCLEMKRYEHAKISTIYVGGGTPSILSKENMAALFNGIYKTLDCSEAREITVEGNPESLEFEKLVILKSLGVNRLSIGVQSFDDEELIRLGRVHTAGDFVNAYGNARILGFKNLGLDLIYGISGQSFWQWKKNLIRAVSFDSEHISLYPLTVEEGTPFYRDGITTDEDVQATFYEWSIDFLRRRGYEQYEISNWSKKGFRCTHNLNYWHNGEYIGIGVSAASYFGSRRYKNTSDIMSYIEKACSNGDLCEESEQIGRDKQLSEEIILNLRCAQGVKWSVEKHNKYGSVVTDLMRQSLLEIDGQNIRLTRKGKLLANQVMMRFV